MQHPHKSTPALLIPSPSRKLSRKTTKICWALMVNKEQLTRDVVKQLCTDLEDLLEQWQREREREREKSKWIRAINNDDDDDHDEIILIILRPQHRFPRPSLAISSGRSSGLHPVSTQTYRFELVVLPLLVPAKGSTGIHHLWVRTYFSSSVPHV